MEDKKVTIAFMIGKFLTANICKLDTNYFVEVVVNEDKSVLERMPVKGMEEAFDVATHVVRNKE